MFTKSRQAVKNVNELVNHKSHVQKKYFSLMLVPSYSTGKTRSIRIPYAVFYCVFITALVVSAAILGFYLRSNYFMHVAQDVSASLDEAQEAYLELQTNLTDEQNRLMDGHNQLKEQLTEEQTRYQIEKGLQQRTYQQNLDGLQEQVGDMERQLRELDELREEVVSELGVNAFIPPIQALLAEMEQSQITLLSTYHAVPITSDERSAATQASERDLLDYFAVLSAKIETQTRLLTDLQGYVNRSAPYIKNYPTTRPVQGSVSSGYGYRKNPMGGGNSERHDGIDIPCRTGTAIRATGGGTVSSAGWNASYGYLVVINHGFGIQTAYAHNSKLLVSAGQQVARGDVIAQSGNTGRSTGPHCHYEVRVNGSAVNPNKYLLE